VSDPEFKDCLQLAIIADHMQNISDFYINLTKTNRLRDWFLGQKSKAGLSPI